MSHGRWYTRLNPVIALDGERFKAIPIYRKGKNTLGDIPLTSRTGTGLQAALYNAWGVITFLRIFQPFRRLSSPLPRRSYIHLFIIGTDELGRSLWPL